MLDLILAVVLVVAACVECCRCNAVSRVCCGRASQTTDCCAANVVAWVLLGKFDLEKTMTVLIVDDNPSVRRLLRRVILGDASSIWECCDGADVERAYAENKPDIVLMDVRMQRMDGLAATRMLRRADPDAKIVIVTDYDDDDVRRAASEAGASGYILKQNLTELAHLVRSIADGNK
jgi:CheY-like chemotaxis protein